MQTTYQRLKLRERPKTVNALNFLVTIKTVQLITEANVSVHDKKNTKQRQTVKTNQYGYRILLIYPSFTTSETLSNIPLSLFF